MAKARASRSRAVNHGQPPHADASVGALRVALALLVGTMACATQRPPTTSASTSTSSESQSRRDWQQLPDADSLRAEYGALPDFSTQCEFQKPLRRASELLDSESWQELDALSTDFLSRCPVDIDFHLLRAIALEETGRNAEALQHHHWRRALVESVLSSGEGDTPESPWVVISVAEEYAILRALGMELQQQLLIDGGIDALTVTADGETRSVYFFPEAHWVRLERQLRE